MLNRSQTAHHSRQKAALAPRKRPSQGRSTETVASIVEAAARILERDGLEGYTTNAVANRAGVSIGSLYQYFPHKDAITRTLIEREAGAIAREVNEAIAADDLSDALTNLVNVAVTRQLARPVLANLLDIEEDRLGGAARPQTEFDLVCAALAARLDVGLRPDDPDALARDVIAIVRTLCDAAGKRPRIALDVTAKRIMGAVSGYLELR